MSFSDLPQWPAWQHRDARNGFEVVFLEPHSAGYRLEGDTAAVEDRTAWAVHYVIDLDSDWSTLSTRVSGRSVSGTHALTLETDGAGRWSINGGAASHLDGCLDVEAEAWFASLRVSLSHGSGRLGFNAGDCRVGRGPAVRCGS